MDHLRSVLTKHSNPLQFKSVFTYCPMNAICGDFTELNRDLVAPSFSAQKVKWFNIGRTSTDSPEGWLTLAHDSTFPNSESAQVEISATAGIEASRFEALGKQKAEAIQAVHAREWFKPVFEEIDRAIFNDKRRVLVHCQQGVSRSATILAAYFINRCDVTPEQALNFLKSRRFCVKSKFTEQLVAYHQAIKSQN